MKNLYVKRINEVKRMLAKQKLAGFLAVTIEGNSKNVKYLTGFGGTTGALLITKNGAFLAVDPRYTLRAKKEAVGMRVVDIAQGAQKKGKKRGNFIPYVEEVLRAAGLFKTLRIGFEGARVSHTTAKAWEELLPQRFIPSVGIVEKMRQVKGEEEIRKLAQAGKRTSQVFVRIAKKIRAGQTEMEIAEMLDSELRKSGAQKNSFDTIVASGPHSAIPHHETGSRRLKAGEPVVLDFGGVFEDGYCSDLTRTVFVPGKKPHAKLTEIYGIVRDANKKALRALKPGMTWKAYDAVAREYIQERGYGEFFTHGLGHSLGLEAHDPYNYSEDAFLPGTVVTNEPGIYIPNFGGVRIEDDVLVTKKGARNLTTAPYLPL